MSILPPQIFALKISLFQIFLASVSDRVTGAKSILNEYSVILSIRKELSLEHHRKCMPVGGPSAYGHLLHFARYQQNK